MTQNLLGFPCCQIRKVGADEERILFFLLGILRGLNSVIYCGYIFQSHSIETAPTAVLIQVLIADFFHFLFPCLPVNSAKRDQWLSEWCSADHSCERIRKLFPQSKASESTIGKVVKRENGREGERKKSLV